MVLAILVGIWIARNWRDWFASFATEGIRQGIEAAQLPAQEQQEIMAQVDRVATAFRDQTISNEQLGKLLEKLVQSPLMGSMMVAAVEQHYFAKSGLSEEEKSDGQQTLRRFIRGAFDGKINEAAIDSAMAHVSDRDAAGNIKLRERVSDADLRAFLAEAKQQADAAAIPEQPAEIDPSNEFKKIVDEAMNAPA